MSTPLRSSLLTFALTALLVLLSAAPAWAMVDESQRGPDVTHPKPSKAQQAVDRALDVVGTPYRWGGSSPSTGFDCSGLIRWAYGGVGIDLPHSSYALYDQGRRVPTSSMKPGDLLFFEGLGHVGMYMGGGRMVHSPQTGRSVEVVRLSATNYGARLIGARRVIAS